MQNLLHHFRLLIHIKKNGEAINREHLYMRSIAFKKDISHGHKQKAFKVCLLQS